jgi:hypothetical protein
MLRDWTDSLKFDGISADAERLFVRLIMKADDYGRFHADSRLLKAAAFPLEDRIRPNDLTRWLDELATRQLILRYEVEGRTYLAIVNYGQRLKSSRAKFPQLPGQSGEWLPTSEYFPEVPGSSRKFRLEGKGREEEVEDEQKTNGSGHGPCAKSGRSVPVVVQFVGGESNRLQALKHLVNGLRPEWSKPAQWNHSEDRLLCDGTAGQMDELVPDDWELLREYFAAMIDPAEKGFWRPESRSKFVETFPSVFSCAQKWAEKHGREKPKKKLEGGWK